MKMAIKSIPFSLLFFILFLLFGCNPFIIQKRPEVDVLKKYPPKLLMEDLDFMLRTYEDVHPNLFLYTPDDVIDSNIILYKNQLKQPLASLEFWKLLAPVTAKFGDGHTFVNFPYLFRQKYLDNGGRIFPLNVRIDGNQLFVKENYSLDSTLAVNSKILFINNIPGNTILRDLRRYKGAEQPEFINRYVQRMFKPLLWVHYGFENNFKVEYVSSLDGKRYTKTLLGLKSVEYDSLSHKKKSQKKPVYWNFQIISDESIGIIDLNSFAYKKNLEEFKKFLNSVFTQIQQENIKTLIIDLRGNGGGENLLGEALIDYLASKPWVLFSKADFKVSKQIKSDMFPWVIRWIPIKTFIHLFSFMYTSVGIEKVEFDSVKSDLLHVYMKSKKFKKNPLRFNGNTYVLIDRGSFSMSVMFAAVMKDYGFATLIGEETGQSANPYGGNYFFNLPNTRLRASVPCGRSYRPSGRVTGRGVIPDFQVKQTEEDLKKRIDTIMEFTKELIRKNATNNAKTD